MRSSDLIEGPMFLGLKRIIIIIFHPGSGHGLHYEHERTGFMIKNLKANIEVTKVSEISVSLMVTIVTVIFVISYTLHSSLM